jgi:hypothetical protein
MAAGKQPEVPAGADLSKDLKKPVAVAGVNGNAKVDPQVEIERAQGIARRYRCEFIDLRNFQLQHDLFRKIPVHLMFSYNFIPLEGCPSPLLIPAS